MFIDHDILVLLILTGLCTSIPLILSFTVPEKYRVRALYSVATIFFLIGIGLVILAKKSLAEPAGDISHAFYIAMSIPPLLTACILAAIAWLWTDPF